MAASNSIENEYIYVSESEVAAWFNTVRSLHTDVADEYTMNWVNSHPKYPVNPIAPSLEEMKKGCIGRLPQKRGHIRRASEETLNGFRSEPELFTKSDDAIDCFVGVLMVARGDIPEFHPQMSDDVCAIVLIRK